MQVDRWPADLFQYFAGDFAVLVRPRDGVFVEMRTSGNWSRKDLDRLSQTLSGWMRGRGWRRFRRRWSRRWGSRAAAVLADVPLPPGFDVAALEDIGVSDAYQFGMGVMSRVGCGWIAEWQRARVSGDEAAVRRAADVLRGSHGWRVLRELDRAGDWPEVFWGYADEVAAGTLRAGYSQGLGCA
ncbi:hypothetical protein F8271_13540 [Micromonospora sp. ALFpr18c]|nr:hypothetical protein F8271_13540 [Micromonospora sp. ALFpr18c]